MAFLFINIYFKLQIIITNNIKIFKRMFTSFFKTFENLNQISNLKEIIFFNLIKNLSMNK